MQAADPFPEAPEILVTRDKGADPALPLPDYATAGAAGADVRADLRGGGHARRPSRPCGRRTRAAIITR